MYVYWRRAAHYPSFATFDAPSREVCTLLRPRTSTPLQSLVLMNDPVYVEAARALAATRHAGRAGTIPKNALTCAFRTRSGRAARKARIGRTRRRLRDSSATTSRE